MSMRSVTLRKKRPEITLPKDMLNVGIIEVKWELMMGEGIGRAIAVEEAR